MMHAYVYKVHVPRTWFTSGNTPTCPSYMTPYTFEKLLGANGYGARFLNEHDAYFPTEIEAVCFSKNNGLDPDDIECVLA